MCFCVSMYTSISKAITKTITTTDMLMILTIEVIKAKAANDILMIDQL